MHLVIRVLLLASIIVAALLSNGMRAQTRPSGVVQGTVAVAETGERLEGARITVRGSASGTGVESAQAPVMTDSGGTFTIRNVPVGTVVVEGQLQGYFGKAADGWSSPIASATVAVLENQAVDVRLFLVAGGMISGRVLDPAGRPMRDIEVGARSIGYKDGTIVLERATQRTTDDRGEYRLFGLAPGEYQIVAVPKGLPYTLSTGVADARETPVWTFFPGVTDIDSATPVGVRSGQETSGVDVRIRVSRTVSLSGRVVSVLPPGPVVRSQTTAAAPAGTARSPVAQIALVPRAPLASNDALLSATRSVKEDNTFFIGNVLPGPYDLIARLPVETGWGELNPPGLALAPWAFGRIPIEVRDAPVENISITVWPGQDIRGVVSLDGKPAAAAVRISFYSEDASRPDLERVFAPIFEEISRFEPAIGNDGSFSVPMVPQGRYRIRVTKGRPRLPAQTTRAGQAPTAVRLEQEGLTDLPARAYVADIRQANSSVYDNRLIVGTAVPEPIEILMRTDPASIDGSVSGSNQERVAGATVVLVPAAGRRENTALYQTARSDSQGQFEFSIVPPGPYKVFAWESVPDGAYQNAAFVAKFEERGIPVTVTARASATVSVPWIAHSISR